MKPVGKHRHFRIMLNLTLADPVEADELAKQLGALFSALPKGKCDWYYNATDAAIPEGFSNAIFGPDHLHVGKS